MKKSAPLLIGFILSAMLFSGCSPRREYTVMEEGFYFMNSPSLLTVYDYFYINRVEDGGRTSKFQQMAEEVNGLLSGLDSALSTSYQTSDISRFNAAAAGATVEIGEDTYNVLSIAKSVYSLTEGYYNPAVYYSVQAYGFNGAEPPESAADLPSEEEISIYVELSEHFGDLKLTAAEGKYYAEKPAYTAEFNGETLSLKLDLGGIGKGYAADKADRLFEKYGYEYGKFNFASSSVAFKRHPLEDNAFTLALVNPRRQIENGTYVGRADFFRVAVSDVAVSSGGDYENYYELAGENGPVRYCHIFNPFTGKPIESGIMSATVIGGSAAENDALTTAIMAMGPQKAVEFINSKLASKQVVFTCDTGGYKYYTNIPEGFYQVVNDSFTRLEIT